MIVARGRLLHLGAHLHQIILFIVIITSHLLYSLAAELAVGHFQHGGDLEDLAGIIVFS